MPRSIRLSLTSMINESNERVNCPHSHKSLFSSSRFKSSIVSRSTGRLCCCRSSHDHGVTRMTLLLFLLRTACSPLRFVRCPGRGGRTAGMIHRGPSQSGPRKQTTSGKIKKQEAPRRLLGREVHQERRIQRRHSVRHFDTRESSSGETQTVCGMEKAECTLPKARLSTHATRLLQHLKTSHR